MNENKLIGMLTFHNAENYGAVLQTCALQKAITQEAKSDNVFVIDYKNRKIEKEYTLIRNTFFKNRTFFRNLLAFFCQFVYIPARILLKFRFNRFRHLYLNTTNRNISDFSAIIYGSDQIWNPVLTDKSDRTYFGEKYTGKKIAYAVSDGGQLALTESVLQLIADFEKISCREQSLSFKIQKKLYGRNIQTVCDPVFFLTGTQWKEYASFPKEQNYILVYNITENDFINSDALRLSQKMNKKVIQLVYIKSIRKCFCSEPQYRSNVSPQSFLGYFFNADFIMTTSFHGTAFSIILRKQFYSYALTERAERITDLLAECGLSDRYIQTLPQNKNNFFMYTNEIESKITDYITKSKQFLIDAIGELNVF